MFEAEKAAIEEFFRRTLGRRVVAVLVVSVMIGSCFTLAWPYFTWVYNYAIELYSNLLTYRVAEIAKLVNVSMQAQFPVTINEIEPYPPSGIVDQSYIKDQQNLCRATIRRREQKQEDGKYEEDVFHMYSFNYKDVKVADSMSVSRAPIRDRTFAKHDAYLVRVVTSGNLIKDSYYGAWKTWRYETFNRSGNTPIEIKEIKAESPGHSTSRDVWIYVIGEGSAQAVVRDIFIAVTDCGGSISNQAN
jgi:hypothetical protein